MENHSSLEQNLNNLSRLKVDLKHTKDQVAKRGKWDMVAWLKRVRVRESQVDETLKEFNEKTASFFLNDLHAKDVLYNKVIENLIAVKVLIAEGKAGSESIPVQLSSLEENQLKLFSSEDLKKITHFDKILGRGGYSTVYQGNFEGEQVAVKVLKKNGMVHETFLAERITMGRIFHTNLVKLYGFCFDDDTKALVYECMEKGSFDKILYKNPYSVEWSQLYGIAVEIARGLAHLHHDCGEQIIHHDVKAANVLLDKNLCPKITDFGVSNLMRSDATHITNTRTRGTDFYSAPEVYLPFFPISCKCDVYSFGIMMFEILGRRCSIPIKGKIWFPKEVSKMCYKEPESLREYRDIDRENAMIERVMEYCGIMEKDRKKATTVLMVAMWCAQYTPTIRPSMRDVVVALGKEMSVTTPPYPFYHHNFGHSMVSSLQGTPVNVRSWVISSLTQRFFHAFRKGKNTVERIKELEEYSPMFIHPNRKELEEYLSSKKLYKYSANELKYSLGILIGVGGYGKVYIGGVHHSIAVAIKVFREDDDGLEAFMSEARVMSTLYHENILRIYGYCFEKNMTALVYPVMRCFDKILYMKHDDASIVWGEFYKIVIEIAKGLSYLHEGSHHPIIHFDVKPSNILLDRHLSPKIKSFGLAKSMATDVSHLTLTKTKLTPGYAAPEMLMPSFPITCKVDVYSFGIMMFEVLGRRNNHQPGQPWFPKQVWKKFETGEIEEFIEDCGIERESIEDAKILSMIALWCVQYTPDKRPLMGTVVNMLEKKLPVTPPPNPFQFKEEQGRESEYYDDEEVEEKEEGSESFLKLYEEKCPPGGENSVIIYTTTIERMKRSFRESNDVRAILRSHQVKIIERDVLEYEDELKTFVEGIVAPVMFVKGRLIGGADEVKRLEADGKLKLLLYGIPTEDIEAIKSSERLLELFEKKCPPGGENKVVLYTTTIARMKRRFEESNEVRAILQSHDIEMIERDVWGDDVDYEAELIDLLGKMQIPVLFVKGRLIGATDDVKSLEASGELKVLLYGL